MKYISTILYAMEGFIIGFFGQRLLNDVVLPIFIAAVCSVITVLIQFFLKRWLNSRDYKKGMFKQNGRK